MARPQPLARHQGHGAAAQTASLNPAGQVAIHVLIGPGTNHQANSAALVIDQVLHHPCPPAADRCAEGGGYVQAVVPFGTAPGANTAAVVARVAEEFTYWKHPRMPGAVGLGRSSRQLQCPQQAQH